MGQTSSARPTISILEIITKQQPIFPLHESDGGKSFVKHKETRTNNFQALKKLATAINGYLRGQGQKHKWGLLDGDFYIAVEFDGRKLQTIGACTSLVTMASGWKMFL